MASQLGYVINASATQFQLTNTIAGQVQSGDSVTLPPNSLTKTGGSDNDWIRIPDATPPPQYFIQDNTCFNAGSTNLYIYGTNGVVYWLVNSAPTSNNYGNQFLNSGNFTEGLLVISQENGNWLLALYDVNSVR